MIDIRALTKGFPADRQSLVLAYEESKSLVEYIINEFGVEGILGILENLRQGMEWQEAMERGLSLPLEEFVKGWRRQLKESLSWFTYVSHNLYEILFFLAALIMVCGFIRAYKKKRAYIGEEDSNAG